MTNHPPQATATELLLPREGLEDTLFDALYDNAGLMGVATRKAAKACVTALENHAARPNQEATPEEDHDLAEPPPTLEAYLAELAPLDGDLADELRLWAKHLRTWTCDVEQFGTVRPLKVTLKDAADALDTNRAKEFATMALASTGRGPLSDEEVEAAKQQVGATPGQEATRTVGDGELAKQLRAAATKNYRYGLPGGVSSLMLDAAERLTAKPDPEAVTIPMLLYCPNCGLQHIDAPDDLTPDWTNPPHKSHLCHGCGCIWRPADVPTNGVAVIETRGKADTWSLNMLAKPNQEATRTVGDGELVQRLEDMRDFCENAAREPHPSASNRPHPNNVVKLCRDVLAALTAKPDPEAVIRMELVEALRIIDAAKAHCPFDKEHHPPSSKPCPKCQADSTEPCRKQVLAAFDCVDQVRALLTKATRPEGST